VFSWRERENHGSINQVWIRGWSAYVGANLLGPVGWPSSWFVISMPYLIKLQEYQLALISEYYVPIFCLQSRVAQRSRSGLVFWRCWVLITAGTSAFLTDVFRGFPQYAQENSWIVPRLDHDRVLSDPFQFICWTSYCSALCSLRYWNRR
jgi:hypothetical protein